jgi:hypothetical protein
MLHVYRTYFRKKFPFKPSAIETAADEAAVGDEDRAYLNRMIELKGKPYFLWLQLCLFSVTLLLIMLTFLIVRLVPAPANKY